MGSERVRQSPGHAHFWRWKRDPTRTFAIRSVPHPAVEMRHNAAFPLQGAEQIGSQRCGMGWVSTAKSGRDPDLAVPVLASFSVLLRWGTENETRRLKGSREILATHPLR